MEFGLTEVVLPLVVGALTTAGVGAATAGTIGAIAAPALVGAGLGAGAGGLTAAVTGGKVLKGMGYGALAGGALGTGVGALGAYAPETAASLGLGGIGGVPEAGAGLAGDLATSGFGLSSQAALGTGAMDAAAAGYPAAGMGAGALASSLDPVTAAAYGLPEAETAAAGATGAAGAIPGDVGVTPEIIGSNPGGYLGAGASGSGLGGLTMNQALRGMNVVGALGSAFAKPQAPNYGITPGPSTTAATQGPLFNQPLTNFGSFNRTPVKDYAPLGGDWYKYGEVSQANNPFFNNNSVGIGNTTLSPYQVPLRMAHGGALARALFEAGKTHGARMAGGGALGRTFSTENGENAVRGPGTSTSDSIAARLSAGEYVLTEKDVSKIGGSGGNDAGARKLDAARRAGAKKIPELLSKARAA